MYWDFTPSKILEHFGFQSTRQTAAKFKPCKGIEKDEHKDVKTTVQRIHAAEFAAVQRIHAAEFAAKSALKLAKEQGSHTQQAAHDEFFSRRGVNVQAASGHLPVSQSPLLAAFANKAPRNPSTSAAESPVLAESPARPTGGAVTKAVGGR